METGVGPSIISILEFLLSDHYAQVKSTLQGALLFFKDHLLAQPLLNIVITSTWKELYPQSSSLGTHPFSPKWVPR